MTFLKGIVSMSLILPYCTYRTCIHENMCSTIYTTYNLKPIMPWYNYNIFCFRTHSSILSSLHCYSVFDFSRDTVLPEIWYRKHNARNTQLGKILSLYSFKQMSVWTAPAIVMISRTHPTFLVSLRIRARAPANSIIPVTNLYVIGFGWYPNKMVTQTWQYCWNFRF